MTTQTLSIVNTSDDGSEFEGVFYTANPSYFGSAPVPSYAGFSFLLTAQILAGATISKCYFRVYRLSNSGGGTTLSERLALENADPATNTRFSTSRLPSTATMLTGVSTVGNEPNTSTNEYIFGESDDYPHNLVADMQALVDSYGTLEIGDRINVRHKDSAGSGYSEIEQSSAGTHLPQLIIEWTGGAAGGPTASGDDSTLSRRNRPGRGPRSLGRYFRPIGQTARPAHTTSGDLAAGDSAVSGAAAHPHTTTGVLAAQAASIAGTALHPHTTTGVLSAQAATVTGAALHPHTSTGTLAAQAATVAGAALHPHTSTGALAAQAASVAGTSAHLLLHTSTGALAAGVATVAGTALHPHAATGALAAQASTVAGSAGHLGLHTSTGVLAAGASAVSGVAVRGKDATGSLVAGSSAIAGTATHLGLHTATGALAAGDASVVGTAAAPFIATGTLSASDASVAGSAAHITIHATSGVLAAQSATVSGDAAHTSAAHTTTGSLSAQAAAVVGAATRFAIHATSGALVADASSVSGDATGPGAAPYVPTGGRHVGPGFRPRPFEDRPRDLREAMLERLKADDLKILALLQEQVDAGVFDQP